jgi:hypothetical protein
VSSPITAVPPATPAPAPVPAPKPVASPAPVASSPSIVDPTTTTTYPMSQSPEGIVQGTMECNFGTISRGYPVVNSPTGSIVFSLDKLWARPTSNPAGWYVDKSGELFYNGTYHPVFDWYNAKTNQVAFFGNQDLWYMNTGYTATVVQYVWDEGIWYHSDESQQCAF